MDIDDLAADLLSSASVSEGNAHAVHPHFGNYKNLDKEKQKQRERRAEALERQKT
jgi:hypothetical protein